MKRKQVSRKQKVDPVLAAIIKGFLEGLEDIDDPGEEASKDFIEQIKNSSIKSFKPFYSEEERVNIEDEQLTQFMDIFTSLSSQNIPDISTAINEQDIFEGEMEKGVTPETRIFSTFQFLNFICKLLEKKSLIELYQEVREGNEESLFKLLRYDKTLFDHEWFREVIFQEMLIGDSIFFEKLGDAIKSEPPISKHKQGKLKLILVLFWETVFSKLTYQQQMELLDHVGLEVPFSPDTYKKLIKREIKPLFNEKQ